MTPPLLLKRVRIGRLQLSLTVYKHVYPTDIPDRWVFQTGVIYDRKRKR